MQFITKYVLCQICPFILLYDKTTFPPNIALLDLIINLLADNLNKDRPPRINYRLIGNYNNLKIKLYSVSTSILHSLVHNLLVMLLNLVYQSLECNPMLLSSFYILLNFTQVKDDSSTMSSYVIFHLVHQNINSNLLIQK